jgi:glycosyltransferase involved in cell wall biosynthesis
VSAVIVTLGRPTLRSAVDSICRQSLSPFEIVIVNDSSDQTSVTSELGVPVVEEFTGGLRGIGAARNLGVARARGEFIAYLDDDDLWYPHHLSVALGAFQRHPELDLHASTMTVAHPDGLDQAAKVFFQGRQDLVDFYYGRYCWAGRRRSIPSCTWVFRRATCDLPMDEDLRDRMDVWWLLNLDRAGRVIRQSPMAGGIWFEDPDRTFGRYTVEDLIDWALRIETLSRGAGQRFIVGVAGRLFARRGMSEAWTKLMERAPRELWIGWDYRAIRGIEKIVLRHRASPEPTETR